MSWVDGIGPVVPPARTAPRPPARNAGFAVPSGRAEAAAGPAAPAGVSLGGMLALQEAESGEVRDREARRHGNVMLAELVRLQQALLEGRADPATLRRLAVLAGNVPAAADPGLRQAMADVALRARVELARHETITTS